MAKVVPVPEGAPTTLYGWAYPPFADVCLVKLDDGRDLLIKVSDIDWEEAVAS